jgi:hypothetical protein
MSFSCVITLTAAATEKTTTGNCQYCRYTTLVNSTSTALPIGLPPKGAEFCYTSKILLVGHQCCHALLQMYFYSYAAGQLVGWSSVSWSTIRVAGI